MINRIRNAMFRIRFRVGCDEREVDTYLDQVIAQLEQGQSPVPPDGFSTSRLRPGYVPEDVEVLVSEITGSSIIGSRTDDSA